MTPLEVLLEYNLTDVSIESLFGGIVNRSWKVASAHGAYVLQEVNAIYKSSVMDDLSAVYTFLDRSGFVAPEIILAKNGRLYVEDNARFWRLVTFITGKKYDTIAHPELAYQAGKTLGSYHSSFRELQHEFVHVRLDKDNIRLLCSKVKQSAKNSTNRRINDLLVYADDMLRLHVPTSLPIGITHGDPKISNMIFDANGTGKHCLIDFDDCGSNQSLLYDLGKAFRSWCGIHTQQPGVFDLELFKAAAEGYCEVTNKGLRSGLGRHLFRELQLRTLQTAFKFILDYFRNSYFQWANDKFESSQAFNLHHAELFVGLYRDLEAKKKDINKLVERWF